MHTKRFFQCVSVNRLTYIKDRLYLMTTLLLDITTQYCIRASMTFSFHQADNLVNAVQSFLPLSPVTRKVAALQTYKKAERFSALQTLVHSDSSIFMFTCTANCTDVHSWSAVLYFHVNSIITLNRPEYQLRMEHGNKISCICMCLCRPTSRRQ